MVFCKDQLSFTFPTLVFVLYRLIDSGYYYRQND